MLDYKYIYQGVIDYLTKKYDYIDVTINLWFKPLTLMSIEGNVVTMLCDNDWKRSVVMERYFSNLVEGFEQELEISPVDLVIVTEAELEKKQKEEQKKKEEEEKRKEEDENGFIYINPSYTFQNFVVGSSNRVAYETSLLVCNNPAEYYNPLFLYGPSGLGKTHLLFSIINEIKTKRPDFNVIYITCEQFTNLLVESISKKSDPMIFRSKFRNLDFLLIDDIQFLANKKVVQEEMFHTFEALYNKGKQVVFASDRHPSELENIDVRLKTRFSMGGLIDIEPPDTELRQAIFKHKAESYGVKIPDNVLFFLADNIKTNIRQIEGAIKTLRAHSLIDGVDINLAMAKKVLSEYLRKAEADSINAEKILKYVSMRYNIKKEDIMGPKRDSAVKNARHICAYLMRSMLNMTYKDIGTMLGKHHSTIMESYVKIEANIKSSDTFRKEIEEIERGLMA